MSKGLEAINQLKQNNVDNSHLFDNELFDIIEIEIKALEIIKETQVNIFTVIHSKNYEDFRKKYFDINCLYLRFPTQEEYDLLKEVLS